MSRVRSSMQAVGLAIIAAALATALFVQQRVAVETGLIPEWVTSLLPNSLMGTVSLGVGTLILLRAGGNPLGWVFIALGTVAVALLPAGALGHTTSEQMGVMATFGLLAYAMLVFPTGRLGDRRDRWGTVSRLAATMLLVALVVTIGAASGLLDDTAGAVGEGAIMVLLAGAAISLVGRLRSSSGVARAQLAWPVWAFTLMVVTVFGSGVAVEAFGLGEEHYGWAFLGFLTVPISFAVAILRYRLFEIDRIVRRTVSYAGLAVLLGGTYAAVTLTLGSGLGRDEPLTVAMATLAVAASFAPLRRRIQSVIDRRFNRRRYDATRTLEAFVERLHRQFSQENLLHELEVVVIETMQPATFGIWLATAPIRRLGLTR